MDEGNVMDAATKLKHKAVFELDQNWASAVEWMAGGETIGVMVLYWWLHETPVGELHNLFSKMTVEMLDSVRRLAILAMYETALRTKERETQESEPPVANRHHTKEEKRGAVHAGAAFRTCLQCGTVFGCRGDLCPWCGAKPTEKL